MKSSMKACFTFIITAILILMSTTNVVSALNNSPFESSINVNKNEIQNQQQEILPTEKRPVHLNMKEGSELSPEQPASDATPKIVPCPAKLEPMHPRLPGKFINQYVWTKIATPWVSRKISSQIFIEHQAKFNVFITSNDDNIGRVNFIFTLKRNNNEVIASTDSTDSVSVNKNDIVEVSIFTVVNLSLNQGDKIYLYIDYWVNGDGLSIIYDEPAHLSGVELFCDALNIIRVEGHKDGLCAIYSDAFFVTPARMIFVSIVDEVIIDTMPTYDLTDDGYRKTHWDYSLRPGTHAVEVMLSYGGTDNTTMASYVGTIDIPKEQKIELFGLDISIWFQIIGVIVVIGILAAIGVYIKRRREEKLLQEYRDAS